MDLQVSPSSDADYTVLFTLECLENKWKLLDLERMRVGDGQDEKFQVNRLDEVARKYNAYEVKIESNGFQKYFANAFRETDHKFGLNIEDHDTRGEKHDQQIGIPSLRSLFVNDAFEHPWGDPKIHTEKQINHTREMMAIFEAELAGWQYNIEKKRFESKARHDDCLHPDTLIKTKRGWIEIANIIIGDYVLTHNNRYKKVLKIGKRKVRENEKIFKMKSLGKLPIIISENHPFYVSKQKLNWKNRTNTIYFDSFDWLNSNELELSKPRQCHVSLYPINIEEKRQIIDMYEYAPKSYRIKNENLISILQSPYTGYTEVLNPKSNPINRFLEIDESFGIILGLFGSDGSTGKHNVFFSGNRKEIGIRNFIDAYFSEKRMNVWNKNIDNNKNYSIGYSSDLNESNGYIISFGSIIYRNFFKQFGKHEHKKYPSWVEFLPINIQESILAGHIAGDGSLTKGNLTVVTISKVMGFQLFDMFVRCGYRPSISLIKSKIKNHKDQYNIRFGKKETSKIYKKLPKWLFEGKTIKSIKVADRDDNSIKSDGKYLYSKFNKKDEIDYTGYIYNLQIETDESYVANGYIVHNCVMAFWFSVLSARGMIDEGYDQIGIF